MEEVGNIINDNANIEQTPIATRTECVGHWTDEEHQKFLEALDLYGKNWKLIQQYIGTRTITQTRSHAQKYFNKLKKMKNSSKAEGKSGLAAYRIKKDEKIAIAKEEPKKEKLTNHKRKLQCESKLNVELEEKHYLDNVKGIASENKSNKNSELFLEEIKCTPLEPPDSLDFDSANIPQMPPLAIYENDSYAYMSWENDLYFDNFHMHPNDSFLFGEARGMIFMDEAVDYSEFLSMCASRSFGTLFEN